MSAAPTSPFDPAPEHLAMTALTGRWKGKALLWIDPAEPPGESDVEALVESLYGGRWIRIEYQGLVMGKPHAGTLVIGFHKDAGEHESSWIDTFHTGTSILTSAGKPSNPGEIDVRGTYAAGAERWGWRTVLSLAGDEMILAAFNISPDGKEYPAIENRLRREVMA
jgi:hypothetical protein